MGMGEPLNNYANVVAAGKVLVDVKRFNLSPGRVTVSTVGVVNRMKSIHADLPGVSLALSLHAPSQDLRQKIIPTAKAYPLHKLMGALKEHLRQREKSFGHNQFVMIEYILLSGVNDMENIAEELAKLLLPLQQQVKVNLIPYNPIFNPQGLAQTFEAPSEESIKAFKSVLSKKYGIFCTVRTEMGQDVNGACGQLACVAKAKPDYSEDIEDMFSPKKSKSQLRLTTKKQRRHKPVHLKFMDNRLLLSGVAVAALLSLTAIYVRRVL